MKLENIIIENKKGIKIITVNRPKYLNALNKKTIKELNIELQNANKDIKTKVVIITGSGEKAFVAGADIKEFSDFDAEKGADLSAEGHNLLFDFIENLSKPCIAAINGFALGGGLELAMSCHIRIASENAKMGLPETSLGLIPGYGGTQRLASLVGKGKANEMIFTAQMINAENAYNWGLVNHVLKQNELLTFCENLATKIMKNSSKAISTAIKSINAGYNKNGYKTEITSFGKCFETHDFKEGTQAFLEKRKPVFKGE